jgi:hypothetical protein
MWAAAAWELRSRVQLRPTLTAREVPRQVYTRIDSQFLSGHIQFLSTPSKRAEVESPVELLLLALGGNGGERGDAYQLEGMERR